MNDIQQALFSASTSVLSQLLILLPRLIWALFVFVIGIIFSNWAKRITMSFIRTFKLQRFLSSKGLEKFLKQAHLPHGLDNLLGQIVRWIVLLIFFRATINILNLTAVSEVLGTILAYVPNVLSAVLILALGILIAGVLEGVVKGAVTSGGGRAARLLGKTTSYTIMVFVILAAIAELKIAQTFIQTIFVGFVAMLALSLGLAIGLGGKSTAEKIISGWYQQNKK